MKKVLFVCTVPALESYSIGVISAAFANANIDCYAFILLNGKDQRSRAELMAAYMLPEAKINHVEFHLLASSKVVRILSTNSYLNKVIRFLGQHDIQKVHFISQDVMLSGFLSKFKAFELYYTVHDLTPHAAKLSFLQRIKHYYLRIRKDKLLVKQINNLVTSSIHQKEKLEQLYPEKNVIFHRMPGLDTPTIRDGNVKVKELINSDNYILFFGRIEPYKGLDQLYQAFCTDKDLASFKLVIAGKGNIYFERHKEKESNITFINRYINDNEVKDLFNKSVMFVLPYRSATQSAVTSIGYHYCIPVVASNIDGLSDTIIHEKTGLLYKTGDQVALAGAINRLLSDKNLALEIKDYLKNEQSFFDPVKLGYELANIY